MKGITSRRTFTQDYPSLAIIDRESLYPCWLARDFRRALNREATKALTAFHNGAPVGFVMYETAGDYLVITRLAVGRKYRRQGVGRYLVDLMRQKLADTHRSRLYATVNERNVTAQLFLKSCGLRCEQIRGPEGSSETDLYIFCVRAAKAETARV